MRTHPFIVFATIAVSTAAATEFAQYFGLTYTNYTVQIVGAFLLLTRPFVGVIVRATAWTNWLLWYGMGVADRNHYNIFTLYTPVDVDQWAVVKHKDRTYVRATWGNTTYYSYTYSDCNQSVLDSMTFHRCLVLYLGLYAPSFLTGEDQFIWLMPVDEADLPDVVSSGFAINRV